LKISAVPAQITPTADATGAIQPSNVQNYRSIKMTTDATPNGNGVGNGMVPQGADTLPEQSSAVTQPLSPQLALLAKQRRALQLKEREIAKREQALSGQQPGESAAEFKARLKSDPLGLMLENEVTYDQLTQAILARQEDQKLHALEEKLNAMDKSIEEKFAEREAAAERQVLAEIQREATQLVKDDRYELVREMGHLADVPKLAKAYWDEHKIVLTAQEALDMLEETLSEDLQRSLKFKKLQSLLPQQQVQQQLPQQRPAVMRTLTNRDTASPVLSRRQRALAAFSGQLK
jgi:hypothetical protein